MNKKIIQQKKTIPQKCSDLCRNGYNDTQKLYSII